MTDFATNRKARFNYQILETFEAGIVLSGFEVKAIRNNKANIDNAFVTTQNNELFLINMQIPPYQKENVPKEYDAARQRKLLMHKKQISSLIGSLKQKGLSLIPLNLYGKKNKIKIAIALAKGKGKIDKRETIKRRESEREMHRMLKRS